MAPGKTRRRTEGRLTSIFVALDGGSVALELDDLTDQLIPADLDELVHFGAGHVLSDDHYRARKQG